MKTRSKTRMAIVICALLFPVLSAGIAQAQNAGKWWNRNWRYRKRVKTPGKGTGAYHIWLRTGNRAAADGRDLRVVDPAGQPLPSRTLHSRDTGRHLVMFPRSDKAEEASGNVYSIYFGNPSAGPPPTFNPGSGLTLQTRPLPEGTDVSTWEDARQALQRARTVHGMGFRNRIFDGYNPYGPQDGYISVYNGVLRCRQAGTYHFAVMSEDASFLFINGKKVAEWTGRNHNINRGRHGQHGGDVRLPKGNHQLRYVAFAFGQPKRCGVVWAKPDAEKRKIRGRDARAYPYTIMDSEAFGSVPSGQVMVCQDIRSRVCADFAAHHKQYLETGNARMVAVHFRSHSYVHQSAVSEYQWDFGDGQSSTDTNPMHVFLNPGTFDVTLTVKAANGLKDTFKTQVEVEPVWNDLDFRRPKKQRFWQWTSNYNVKTLPTKHLLAFQQFLRDVEKRKKLFAVCQELDTRRKELEPVEVHEVAMDLGKYYLQPRGEWEMAEKYIKLARDVVPENDLARRFDARFHLADLYFYYADRPERARQAYLDLREQFPATDPVRRRVALIRLGDIQRNQGHLDKAHELYKQAQEHPQYGPNQGLAILEGRYTHDIRAFLNEGKGQRALDTLEDWLWKCPTQRLEGLPTILRLRANMLMGDYREAKKQGETYLSFARDPDHVPQAHVIVGEACLELGLTDQAEKHWQTVVSDWKESPAAKDASNNLRRLRQMGG